MSRTTSCIAVATTLLALVPATQAVAMPSSPDARDAALAAATTSTSDLRSPDARDAAVTAETRGIVDLRSPDARDSGRVVSVPSAPASPSVSPSGSDWDDVGIIGGGALALVLLAGGSVVFLRHRALRRGSTPALPV